MNEPERRRRRPAVSCTLCRRRKIRCDRDTPCSNCARSRNETCIYDNLPSQPLWKAHGDNQGTGLSMVQVLQRPRNAVSIDGASSLGKVSKASSYSSRPVVAKSSSVSSPTSQSSSREVEFLRFKIRELEDQLAEPSRRSVQSTDSVSNSNIETTTSELAGTFHVNQESRLPGQPEAITRNIIRKTRLFGQSHWLNGAAQIRDLLKLMEPHVRDKASSASSNLQKCRQLAKVIKSQRKPLWPSPPKPDLPAKNVADELIDFYLRTTETLYRILHVPTFKRDYEALWISDNEPNPAFLVQVKLVFAIGATSYDESFSLRASAMQWVYEAQTWISEPQFKSRVGIQYLQNNILLLVARETLGVGGELIWIVAGGLFRTAVDMGLHRDPAYLPQTTAFATEMRRRLWNTVLEINLQCSINLGGSPLFSRDDFDTKPPGNFDDDQLAADEPVPSSEETFTQTSTAIALRETFAVRLAVVKHLNDLGSHGTYEETLKLDAELKAAYKALRRNLQGLGPSTGSAPSQYEIRVVELIMHRYLTCLHAPFFAPALHETAYAFSRKVVVETSLKMWYAAFPSTFTKSAQSRGDIILPDEDDLARLMICDTGFFRVAVFQASFFVAMELRNQLQDEDSLGPVPVRPDLLSVFNSAKVWLAQCMEAGETSTKAYLFMCAAGAEIEGLMRGLDKNEFSYLMGQSIEQAGEKCLSIMEGQVNQNLDEGMQEVYDQISLNLPLDFTEGWDFMQMSDTLLNVDGVQPMNYTLSGEVLQGQLLP